MNSGIKVGTLTAWVCAAVAGFAAPEVTPPVDLETAVGHFRSALSAWERKPLEAARDRLQVWTRSQPDRIDAAYWLAVADLHLALYDLRAHERDARQPPLELARIATATESVLRLLQGSPEHAEGHAMLATLIGLRIARTRFGGLRHGLAFQRHMRRALEAGPENPRVHFLAGSSLFYGPSFLGGIDAAFEKFHRATELYPREDERPRTPLEPDGWGRASCWAYLGQIHALRNDRTRARQAFARALELHPRETLALEGLRTLGMPDPVRNSGDIP